jgi:hypothetical protein
MTARGGFLKEGGEDRLKPVLLGVAGKAVCDRLKPVPILFGTALAGT